MITTRRQIACFTGHTTLHSHDHQTDHSLKESHHDNSRQATLASLAIQHFTVTIIKQTTHWKNHVMTYSRQTMIASLAITIFSRQPHPDSNKQVTFYLVEVTFHSHDHQTDNLLKEHAMTITGKSQLFHWPHRTMCWTRLTPWCSLHSWVLIFIPNPWNWLGGVLICWMVSREMVTDTPVTVPLAEDSEKLHTVA